jgi:hypothetical protein
VEPIHWINFSHAKHSAGISCCFWRWLKYPIWWAHAEVTKVVFCGARYAALIRLNLKILVPAQMNVIDAIAPM